MYHMYQEEILKMISTLSLSLISSACADSSFDWKSFTMDDISLFPVSDSPKKKLAIII